MSKFLQGGFLASKKTKIMTGMGVLSALCAYLVGDSDLFATFETLIAIFGFYFLHKSNKGKQNGKNPRKIS